MSRGWIHIAVGQRTIKLSGEMMPSGNPVHFYADLVSIRTWTDGTPVDDADKERIIRELPEAASQRGWTLIVN